MAGVLSTDDPAALATVRSVLARQEAEIDAALDLVRGARDLEWVSDTADLFLLRLDSLTRATAAIGSRIALARDAIRALESVG